MHNRITGRMIRQYAGYVAVSATHVPNALQEWKMIEMLDTVKTTSKLASVSTTSSALAILRFDQSSLSGPKK